MADKDSYHKLKTKDWLKDKGYHVELMERQQRITIKDKKTGNFKIAWEPRIKEPEIVEVE